MIKRSRFLFLPLLFLSAVEPFEVSVESDPTALPDEKATLFCAATKLQDDLESCIWTSPTGERFDDRRTASGHQAVDPSVKLTADGCQLSIRRTRAEHNGPWTCALAERRGDELVRYVFLTVVTSIYSASLTGRQVRAGKGDEAELVCPVDTRRLRSGRPVCSWTSPDGRDYSASGSQGVREGINHISDFNRGECGIRIDPVSSRHFGNWRCSVLQDRSDGKLGTEVVTGAIELTDKFRTDRLREEETLQGHRDGDKHVRIDMNVTLTPNEDRDSELYWIVQRQYLVREDDQNCPKTKKECYYSTARTKMRGQSDKYDLKLEFDELYLEDVVNPVVLVREYRDISSRQKRFQMYFVPRENSSSGALRAQGCVVNTKFVAVGDILTDRSLCVEVECVSDGVVKVLGLRNC